MNLDDLSLEQLQALKAQKTDPDVAAIHGIESDSAPATANPVNPASGARSSMQVMDKTAKKPGYGVKPSDGTPIDDTRTGVEYYQHLRDDVYKDPVKAAVAYNWGPGNADKWIANGAHLDELPLETLKYIKEFKQRTGGAQNASPPAQAAQPALPQPTTTEMNIVEQPAADTPEYTRLGRVEQGVMSGLGGMGRAGLKGLGWLLGKAGDQQGAQTMNDTVQQAEEAQAARDREFALKAQEAGANPNSTDWYQIGGKMIPGFLIPGGSARTVAGAALQGAAGGAVMGAADTAPGESYLENAGKGAAFGGAGGAAVSALGKIIGGARISPDAQRLIDQGVVPTPGQMLGHTANRVEEKLEALPIVGDAIMGARRGAVTDMNRAAYRQALEPLGQSFADNAPRTVGREAIGQVRKTISDQYDNLFPHLTVSLDNQFVQDLQGVTQQARRYMNPDDLNTFNNTVQDTMLGAMSRAGANGTVSGKELKDIETALTDEINRFSKPTASVAEGRIGDALTTVQQSLRSAMMRQNPAMAQELDRINTAWSRYAILRRAADAVKNPENPILPSQLQEAVRQESKQVSKSAFGEGRANMQELADPAMRVLADRYPNSGSAGRLMLNGALLGGGALVSPQGLAAILAGSGLYGTEIGRRAMLAAIAQRPEWARALGAGVEGFAPRAGILSGTLPRQ